MTRLFPKALSTLTAIFLFAAPTGVLAAVQVEPAIYNIEGVPREEFRYTITISNEDGGTTALVPIVTEINAETGEILTPGSPNENHQLSSTWVEMPRKPLYFTKAGSKELPVKVKLNIHAEAGTYNHAVAFVPSRYYPNVPDAVLKSAPRVIVNVKVNEDAVERLNLISFGTVRRIMTGFPVNLTATLLNGGNRDLVPSGRIRILNRGDEEVDVVLFNRDNEAVPVGDEGAITTRWDGAGFGRYKAVLEMKYGNLTDNAVADSTFFWVIPFWLIGVVVGGALMTVVILTFFIHRRVTRYGHR